MKKLVVIFLLIVMAFQLTACNLIETGDDKTQVLIWHTYSGDLANFIASEVQNFNLENEDINVVVESYPKEGFEAKVEEAIANGVGPDIIIHYASEAAKYIDTGLVVDLETYLNDPVSGISDFEENVDEKALDEAKSFSDGKMHFMPLAYEGPVFYYNKAIYDELGLSVPTTWEELAENCRQIKAAYPEKVAFGIYDLSSLALTFLGQSDDVAFDEETLAASFNTDSVKVQLDNFKAWLSEDLFRTKPIGESFSADFNNVTLVSYMAPISEVNNINLENYEVAKIMQSGEKTFTPLKNIGAIIFASDKLSEEASFEVVKFLVSGETNANFCKILGLISPYRLTRENKVYQDYASNNKAILAFSVDEAASLPALEGLNGAIDAITEMLEAIANGEDVNMALIDAENKANYAINPELQSE